MKKSVQTTLLGISLVSVLLESGCATMSVTELKTRPADSYAQHQQKNGVIIGIHPMTDKEEIKETFRINLLDKGLLPILLIVENQSTSTSFILAKEKVLLLREATGLENPSGRKEVAPGTKGTALDTVPVTIAALITPASVPLLFIGTKMNSDATVIQHNLADKELYTRTLGPGQKAEGFVYFQYPIGSPPSGPHHMTLELKNPSTSEVSLFDFTVELTLPKQ